METKQIIEDIENNVIHTYNRYQIALDRGEGVYLYDVEGKKYLDFGAGIGVFALGYQNVDFNNEVKAQIDKLIHTSNYFYNEPTAKAAKRLIQASGMSKAFFTNSGAEAIEGALKLTKKYGNEKKGPGHYEIIAMKHSFHGRTIGAVSVTGNAHYRESFEPLVPGVSFAEFNNFESVKSLVTDKTCAIILETVQGEGGIHPATEEFLMGVRELCDQKDILLILDEIQCGMGRSGHMFAFQKFNIQPDILTSAKALGCGIPVGAFIASEKVAQTLVAGDHGTTYGGNPLATAATAIVFDLYEKNKILENVNEVGAYLYQKIENLMESYQIITEHRGVGLIQGIEFNKPVNAIIATMLEMGCVVFAAGTNVIRFVPPLIISKNNVDEMISILQKAIDQNSQEAL